MNNIPTVSSRRQSVKRFSYADIRSLFAARGLNGEELARRLADKGCIVTPEYVRYLLRGQKKGVKPFGRKVRRMIARELGIKLSQFPCAEEE